MLGGRRLVSLPVLGEHKVQARGTRPALLVARDFSNRGMQRPTTALVAACAARPQRERVVLLQAVMLSLPMRQRGRAAPLSRKPITDGFVSY